MDHNISWTSQHYPIPSNQELPDLESRSVSTAAHKDTLGRNAMQQTPSTKKNKTSAHWSANASMPQDNKNLSSECHKSPMMTLALHMTQPFMTPTTLVSMRSLPCPHIPHGIHMESMWIPCGFHVIPGGFHPFHMEYVLAGIPLIFLLPFHFDSIWNPSGMAIFHHHSMECPYGFHMDSIWNDHGFHME